MAQYRFLARDLEALKRRIDRYDAQWRETLSSVHESTTQSSETWHDNPQFDDVQQRAKMLETERNKLEAVLADSELVQPATSTDVVDLGSVVRVRFVRTAQEERFVIGSYMVLDSDDDERISYAAPLAQLLVGRTKGEVVEGKIGTRAIEVEILRVDLSEAS